MLVLVACVLLSPAGLRAHGDHDHAAQRLTGAEAAERSRHWIGVLSERGKVGPEWADREPSCVHLTGQAPDEEWMATFRDPDPAAAPAAFTIVLDLDGAYLRSSFADGHGNPLPGHSAPRPVRPAPRAVEDSP